MHTELEQCSRYHMAGARQLHAWLLIKDDTRTPDDIAAGQQSMMLHLEWGRLLQLISRLDIKL